MSNRELFGTDGIRGRAGTYPLDSATAMQIGKAIGAYFTAPGDLILIGRDPRESSYALATAVTAGLAAMGADTKMLGVLPTPGLAYLTSKSHAKAGVMITASHNPYHDNGIKVFSPEGGKLPDNTEAKLNELINSEIAQKGFGQDSDLEIGALEYEDLLVASAQGDRLTGLTVILDMANGATSGVATRVFERLGAKVVSLSDQPDGRNINVDCGATHTAPLQKAVHEHGDAVGAAFDGDGDRTMLCDEQGRQLSGDHIMYILAVTGGHKGVVGTIMSNMGLDHALAKHNIKLHRTAVGDRYVLEGMEKTGLTLGGEQSGHIIQSELGPTGDGILAAIQTLRAVRASGKTLSEWRDEIVELPQKLVNIPLTDKSILSSPEILAFIESQTEELGGNGRISVRPSGTEPIARVMVEAPDAADRAQKVADKLSALIAETEVKS